MLPPAPAPNSSAAHQPASASGKRTVTSQRIIVVVESTYTQGTVWPRVREALDSVLRHVANFFQLYRAQDGKQPPPQYALVLYSADDPSTIAAVRSSSWTTDLSSLRQWLDGLLFDGGGGKTVSGTALAAALAEAIYLSQCPYPTGTEPPTSSTGVVTHMLLAPSTHSASTALLPWSAQCRFLGSAAAARVRGVALDIPQLSFNQPSSVNGRSMLGSAATVPDAASPAGFADYVDLLLALSAYHISLSVLLPSQPPVPCPPQDFYLLAHHHMPELLHLFGGKRHQEVLKLLNRSTMCYMSPKSGILGTTIDLLHKNIMRSKQAGGTLQQPAGAGGKTAAHPQQQQPLAGAGAAGTAAAADGGASVPQAGGTSAAAGGAGQQQQPRVPLPVVHRVSSNGHPTGASPSQQLPAQPGTLAAPTPGQAVGAQLTTQHMQQMLIQQQQHRAAAAAPGISPPQQQQQQQQQAQQARGSYGTGMAAAGPVQVQLPAGGTTRTLPSPSQAGVVAVSPVGGGNYLPIGAGQGRVQAPGRMQQQFAPSVPGPLPGVPPDQRVFWKGQVVWQQPDGQQTSLGEFLLATQKPEQVQQAIWPHSPYLLLTQQLSHREMLMELRVAQQQQQLVMAVYKVCAPDQGLSALENLVANTPDQQVGLMMAASPATMGMRLVMVFGTQLMPRNDPQRTINMHSNTAVVILPLARQQAGN